MDVEITLNEGELVKLSSLLNPRMHFEVSV